MADDPLIFISHKHSDSKIAKVLGDFIEAKSGGRVQVYLSSSSDSPAPIVGPSLNMQIRQALWQADVVVLVYTSKDKGWEFCMWECGVATVPERQDTNIVVFQCGSDVPDPFHADLRVNVRELKGIRRFTDQFLRSADFFPSLNAALSPGLKDRFIEDAAQELHDNLEKVLPPVLDPKEWPAWPYMRVELPFSEISNMGELGSASDGEQAERWRQIMMERAKVVVSTARAAQLFGQESFPNELGFGELLKVWKQKYPGADETWFDSCCEQIRLGAKREFPYIQLTPMREVGGEAEFTPVLSRVRIVPYNDGGGSMQFDLYFYNLADPRAVRVTSKMLPMNDFFYKSLAQTQPASIKLMELRKELDARKLNRIPLLGGEWHPLCIIHRSMIEKFILNQLDEGANPHDLTLAEMLTDQEMKEMFGDALENTFVVVKQHSSLAEAKAAMVARRNCLDVFVTANGGRDEPVLGWLTNVDITRSS